MTMTIATIEVQCEHGGIRSYRPLIWCTSPQKYTAEMETATIYLFEFLRGQLGIAPNDGALVFCLYEATPDHTDWPRLYYVRHITKETQLCLS